MLNLLKVWLPSTIAWWGHDFNTWVEKTSLVQTKHGFWSENVAHCYV